MKKIIFLDVDGVLNNLEVLSSREELGKHHLQKLQGLVAATKCDIVLSSSWRHMPEAKTILKIAFIENNIPLWIDQTPDLLGQRRSAEIITWLRNNINDPSLVVVIDDDSDANINSHNLPNICDKFIYTCMDSGLTYDDVQNAIDFFNKG